MLSRAFGSSSIFNSSEKNSAKKSESSSLQVGERKDSTFVASRTEVLVGVNDLSFLLILLVDEKMLVAVDDDENKPTKMMIELERRALFRIRFEAF